MFHRLYDRQTGSPRVIAGVIMHFASNSARSLEVMRDAAGTMTRVSRESEIGDKSGTPIMPDPDST